MSREAMKHTPGPWNYDRSGYSLYVNSGRELVTALSMDGKRLETSEANARLIAAAPDLLSALDDLARYADTCELFLRETHPGKADMLRKRVTAAIDAIAKATGGEV